MLTLVRLCLASCRRSSGSAAESAAAHPSAVIVARLVLGISYLALFMVYVGMGAVFPHRYVFWGLTRGLAGPVVYLFLWTIGVWNLLHTALHRHQVGYGMRAGTAGAAGTFAALAGGWRRRWRAGRQRTGQAPGQRRRFWPRRTGANMPAVPPAVALSSRGQTTPATALAAAPAAAPATVAAAPQTAAPTTPPSGKPDGSSSSASSSTSGRTPGRT